MNSTPSSLSDAATVTEVVNRVRLAANKLKPGEWLTGAGWDEGKLAERRYIVASDLDQASPHNPVWLMHTTGHYGVANHEALRLAHITAEIQGSAGRHHRSRCTRRTNRRAEGIRHGRRPQPHSAANSAAMANRSSQNGRHPSSRRHDRSERS